MPNDPIADYMNTMGLQGLTGPNPYLEYTGQIPMAGYYTGQNGSAPPTDAQGRPIPSFLSAQAAHDAWNAANPAPPPAAGTTLNSTPQQAPFQHATMPDGMPYGQTSLGRGVTGTSWQGPGGGTPQQAPQAPQQSAPAAQQNPIDMRQAYLDALANPGKVTTPGAQLLPGTSVTGPVGSQQQPSVLQSFLAQHPSGGATGNQGFFNTLNALQKGTST